jgi:hypothetical protein
MDGWRSKCNRPRHLHFLSMPGLSYSGIEALDFHSQPVRTHEQLWQAVLSRGEEAVEAKEGEPAALCVTGAGREAGPCGNPNSKGKTD